MVEGAARQIDRREILCLIGAVAFSVPFAGAAADTVAAPDLVTKPVAALNAGLLASMKTGRAVPFEARYAQLEPLIDHVFDLPAILQSAIGPQWQTLAAEEQSQLLDAFRRYTVSTYVANFNKFGGESFVIMPDRRNIAEVTVVPTQIVPASGKPARIDYVLRAVAGDASSEWKIVDVFLDGSISQVAVQRSEFHKALHDGGAKQLIAILERKATNLSIG